MGCGIELLAIHSNSIRSWQLASTFYNNELMNLFAIYMDGQLASTADVNRQMDNSPPRVSRFAVSAWPCFRD